MGLKWRNSFVIFASNKANITVAQLIERVGLCSEGWWFNPRPGLTINDTAPANWVIVSVSLNVYDCCMFVVVVGGAVGSECTS